MTASSSVATEMETKDATGVSSRELLTQATLEELAASERGPSGVSLRAIARRAGLSHNAATHHFGDRSGLLTAVAVVGFSRLEDRLREAGAAGRTAGEDPLRGLGEAYVAFGLAEPNLLELMFRADLLRRDDPELQAAQQQTFAALEEVMGGGRRPAGTPEDLAMVAWAFVHGLVGLARYGALSQPGTSPDGEEVRHRAAHVLNSFGALVQMDRSR